MQKKAQLRIKLVTNIIIAAAAVGASPGLDCQPASAQISGNVTMELFKVVDSKGQRYLQTQTGELLPIEGKRLSAHATAVAIYRDANNNYWFIDKQGQPTSIPPEKVQWAINEINTQRLAKESLAQQSGNYPGNSAPAQSNAPVQQTTIVQQPSNSSTGSSAMGAVGTGLAAAGGAMVGGMLGSAIYDNNHYYGIPYGTPLYRDGNRGYYTNNSGNKVYVDNSHTQPVINQWKQQGDWNKPNNAGGGNAWNNQNKPNYGNNNLNKPSSAQNWNKPTQPISRGSVSHEGWGGFAGRASSAGFAGRGGRGGRRR